jgi:hypothetical protein
MFDCQWFNIAAIKGPISAPRHQDLEPPPPKASQLPSTSQKQNRRADIL